jgi:hypothetical protein
VISRLARDFDRATRCALAHIRWAATGAVSPTGKRKNRTMLTIDRSQLCRLTVTILLGCVILLPALVAG